MLTVILPAILYLRKTIALHGSVIAFNDHCILLTGESGAGKSTIAGRFMQKGCKVLADDLCVLKSLDGKPYVVPASLQLKLNPDSASFLNYDSSRLHSISPSSKKK